QPSGAAPRIRVQGGLNLRDLDIAETSGAPLLAWDSLKADGLALDLGARTVSVDTVTLAKPRTEVHRDASQLNWQRVVEGFAKLQEPTGDTAGPSDDPKPTASPRTDKSQIATDAATAAPAPRAEEPGWKIALGTFKVEAGAMHPREDPSGLD